MSRRMALRRHHHRPEVEVFGHVHLLEDVHEPLFLSRFVQLVIEAYWDYVGVLTMVKIMAPEKSHHRSFRNQ
jgi:hypothetical protein